MKKLFCCWLSFVFVVGTTITFARADNEISAPSKYEAIEANYLKGLESDNQGLRVSSAYFLGDMKSQRAVIPLMKMFRNEKNDGAKLVAAWSLLKIGDSRGVYLVRSASENSDNEQIKYMLNQLYEDYCLKTKGKIQ